jgi:hypothetical protein
MIDRLDPLGNFLLDDKVENCVITGGQRCSLIFYLRGEDGHPTKERENDLFFLGSASFS